MPRALISIVRHKHRMEAIDILIERIAKRLDELRISERAASIEATGSPDAIRYIRARRAMPAAPRLAAIARVLSATPSYLLGEADQNNYIHMESDNDWKTAVKGGDLADLRRRSQSKPTLSETSNPKPGAPFTDLRTIDVPVFYSREFFRDEADAAGIPLFEGADFVLVDKGRFITRLRAVPLDDDQATSSYCLYLPIKAMKPALPVGEPLLATWARPVSEQDLALVYLKIDAGQNFRGEIAIPAQITRVNGDGYELDQLGPVFFISSDQVSHVDRIYTMPDFLR